MQCNRFADHPALTMAVVRQFAHTLLQRPIAHSWSAPTEIDTAAPSRLLLQVHDVVRPLVLCWRTGGFADAGDVQHVWFATEAEAALLGISTSDLAWGAMEAITRFRVLSHQLPRAAALQVVVYELEGWILRPVAHAQLTARYARTTLH